MRVLYGYHCMPASRFPFAIYYRVKNKRVQVVAILNCRMSPDRIRQRLQDSQSKNKCSNTRSRRYQVTMSTPNPIKFFL